MTFKTLLLETPKLFLPLIKEVFGVDYSRDRRIVLLNNEYYSKEIAKKADMIIQLKKGNLDISKNKNIELK